MASDAMVLTGCALLAGCAWFGLLAGMAMAVVRLSGGKELAMEPFIRWSFRFSVMALLVALPWVLACWYMRDWQPDLGMFGHLIQPYLHMSQTGLLLGLTWVTVLLAFAGYGKDKRKS
jgi:hypothetical protein